MHVPRVGDGCMILQAIWQFEACTDQSQDSTATLIPGDLHRIIQDGEEVREACPADHKQCPSSVGGGCCPIDRICGKESCFAPPTPDPSTIAQPKITEPPLYRRKLGSTKWSLAHEALQGQKRAATLCPTDYQLCPSSLSGGCCPTDRICGTSSCYSTASTNTEAPCGQQGYVACAQEYGGGCCPSGYSCGKSSCSPLSGVAYSQTCGTDSYLCPSSLNYGCCSSGLACGISSCYSTAPVTFTMTETVSTTDSASIAHTYTSTTTITSTPYIPTETATPTIVASAISKLSSSGTAISKTRATSDSGSGGLSKATVGAIIGVAVVLLVTLIVGGYLLLRRIDQRLLSLSAAKKSYKAWTSSGRSYTRTSKRTRMRGRHGSESDAIIDPLLDTKSSKRNNTRIRHNSEPDTVVAPLLATDLQADRHLRRPSQPTAIYSPPTDGLGFSAPPFSSPYAINASYNPLPTIDPYPSNSSSGKRTIETASQFSGTEYFDIPIGVDLRDQNLRHGHITRIPQTPVAAAPLPQRPAHTRGHSEPSVSSHSQYAGSLYQTPTPPQHTPELDATPAIDRGSGFARLFQGFGMSKVRLPNHKRRSSTSTLANDVELSSTPISASAPMIPPQPPLGNIYETNERDQERVRESRRSSVRHDRQYSLNVQLRSNNPWDDRSFTSSG